jgi:hypothetical protein
MPPSVTALPRSTAAVPGAARANFERAVALEPGEAYYKRRRQEMSASPAPR